MSDRLKSIDFLRGFAAMAVVLHHAIAYASSPPSDEGWFDALHSALQYGALGVPLFFVVSGFCIHLPWARKRAATGEVDFDFLAFWRRRLYRLYPPYAMALCFSMALVLAAYTFGLEVPLVTLYPEPRLQWMAVDFGAHLVMLHGLIPLFDRAGGNPPLWTIAREEYFYLLYYVLLSARCGWGLPRTVLAVFVLGLVFPLAFIPLLSPTSQFWPIIHTSAFVLWIQWCLGMVAVEAHFGLIKLPRWCSSGWLVLLWAVLAHFSELNCARLAPLLWGMTFFTLVNSCVAREKKFCWPRSVVINWLVGVGSFSYSLYLIHNPVRALVKQCLGSWARTDDAFLYLVNAFVMVLAAYLAAKLYFAVVEQHFLVSHKGHLRPPVASTVNGMSVCSS